MKEGGGAAIGVYSFLGVERGDSDCEPLTGGAGLCVAEAECSFEVVSSMHGLNRVSSLVHGFEPSRMVPDFVCSCFDKP